MIFSLIIIDHGQEMFIRYMKCLCFPGRQIKLTEMKTDFIYLSHLTLLSNGTVAACRGIKLTRYHLETGRTISSTKIKFSPVGMGEVKLRSKSSLVLSYV